LKESANKSSRDFAIEPLMIELRLIRTFYKPLGKQAEAFELEGNWTIITVLQAVQGSFYYHI